MDEQIFSFPPIVGLSPQILILGTMPSVASLRKQEYYGNPLNVFWKIMSSIKGVECPTDYDVKRQLVMNMGIAVWDVCHTCIRPGSADSAISEEQPNRIRELLAEHPTIQAILFNGQTAEKLFKRHFGILEGVCCEVMPSTSPAYTLGFEKKLEVWRRLIAASVF
jgi:double-stranded uracil-DNA glycosylase